MSAIAGARRKKAKAKADKSGWFLGWLDVVHCRKKTNKRTKKMKSFYFTYPVRIHFGKGVADEALRAELPKYGKSVLLAYGGGSIKRTGLYDRIARLLKESGKDVFDFGGIMSNPTYAKVQEGARIAREHHVDFILAVGGGSVSDCCKIVSAQAKTDEDVWTMEYTDHKMPTAFIPMGVVVTASGTGSEENNGAVITNEDTRQKNGMGGAFADFAILDPDLTKTVPMKQVISGAFDTLSHCMETYFGRPSENNVSDEINEAVQRNVIRNIRRIKDNPDDDFARGELMWDSAMGENGLLKLGKTTDFQCHMIEHQLGAYTNCNHGAGLAAIHPALYRHLLKDNADKFARWAEEVWKVSVGGKAKEEIGAAGIDALAAFIKEIGMPSRLSEKGIIDDGILRKVADTAILTPGCTRKLSRDEIYQILQESK